MDMIMTDKEAIREYELIEDYRRELEHHKSAVWYLQKKIDQLCG